MSDKLFCQQIGESIGQQPLLAYANYPLHAPAGAEPLLILGGMHGDEPASVVMVERFVRQELERVSSPVVAIPLLNPDGYQQESRYNGCGVDINRNFGFNWDAAAEEPAGPAPWSEPETCALRDFILRQKPNRLVALHWALAELDADGLPGNHLAREMWQALSPGEQRRYRLSLCRSQSGRDREVFCPGSLGQWFGYSHPYGEGREPAMVTLELPFHPTAPRPEVLPQGHFQEACAGWKRDAQTYLAAVEPPVWRMLIRAAHFRSPSH